MPAQLTYPGVYIEEIPSGVRTIIGVATSITAFVGRALRGPTDGDERSPVLITSYADFERIYGGLWKGSNLGYAVRDFYLNGGSQAVIVRLFNNAGLTAATAQAQTAADAIKQAADAAAAAPAATPQTVATAAQNAVAGASAPGASAQAAAQAVAKAATDAAAVANPAPTAASVAAAATGAVATAVTAAATANGPRSKAHLAVSALELETAYEGVWGNAVRARVDRNVSQEVADRFGVAKGDLFNLTVRDTKGDVTEEFRNLTVIDSPRRVDKVLQNESVLVRAVTPLPNAIPAAHPDPAPGKSVFEDDNASSKVDKPATDGDPLTEDSFIGQGTEGAKKGLFNLERTDLFNILCIPPYNADNNTDREVFDAAAPYCERRRAMLLIDPPSSWKTVAAAKGNGTTTGVAAFGTSKNAALFFPRLRRPDPLRDNQIDDFVPCGALAGVFARTDTQRGVWKAPAGLEATLAGVPQLSVPLTDDENGQLNPLAVNCLRAMPAAGRVVWGSRTLQGNDRLASEWKYIPVRRTTLFIEESLYRGTQWVVFEPNDEPLWSQIRLNVGAFMQDLFRQGAFQGTTPRDAYFVKCDKDTTTQNDINKGIVNIVVGFAPLKPAEFVVIKIQQIAGQIQT